MEDTAKYNSNTENMVILLCDCYGAGSGQEHADAQEIALQTVGGMRLIDAVLCNLAQQSFSNVMICGRRLERLARYLGASCHAAAMKFSMLRTYGETIGDAIREIDSSGVVLRDAVLMQVNTYTNVNLNELLRRHREASPTNLMTLYVQDNDESKSAACVYGTVGNDVVFYQGFQSEDDDEVDAEGIFGALPENPSIVLDMNSTSPPVAVLSDIGIAVFSDNFDYQTVGDFISGVIASRLYDNKIQVYRDTDLAADGRCRSKDKAVDQCMELLASHGKPGCPDSYSRVIATRQDYAAFLGDWEQGAAGLDAGRLSAAFSKMKACQAASDYRGQGITEIAPNKSSAFTLREEIVVGYFGEGVYGDYGSGVFEVGLPPSSLEISVEDSADMDDNNESANESFFSNIYCLLHKHVTTAGLYNTDMSEVYKQISLLRIVWNASKTEIIEAFGFFLVDMLDLQNLEASISKASAFFQILKQCVVDRGDEELLIDVIYGNVHHMHADLKVQILFNYGFLLVQDEIIDKSVIKKYNKLYKAGKF
ncbi:hypothetical protein PAPHI01_0219 [Pancytospora philotis]|nr:hypothetical protein PAPHI01_0219 [Pancytospora philotis]